MINFKEMIELNTENIVLRINVKAHFKARIKKTVKL